MQSSSFTYLFNSFLPHLSLLRFCIKLHFLPSSLHLQSHEICFMDDYDSFIFVVILNTFVFTFFVLFCIQNLSDKSSIILSHFQKLMNRNIIHQN